jgi:hypothetical protein
VVRKSLTKIPFIRKNSPECLPVLYNDHQGNVIYRVPRRWPARAPVVGRLDFPSPFTGER